ncbi:hypothetical protein ACOSQ3_033492 [Xanthoceras sorbifolium]
MADTQNTKIFNTNEDQKQPNNLLSKADVVGTSEEENEIAGSKKHGDVVKFSDPKPIIPPPLKHQVEECENPAARWLLSEIHPQNYSRNANRTVTNLKQTLQENKNPNSCSARDTNTAFSAA